MKNMKKGAARAQKGFTLIEIAIVLVIIGLLLGGVLQGQQLIENSRVKGAINDINGITAAVAAYQDRYRRLPGDDGPIGTLQARGPVGTPWNSITVAGNTDGALTGGGAVAAIFTAAPTVEPLAFWQHLRAAGFISGNPADATIAALPANSFGGVTNVTSVLALGIPAGQMKICMNNLTGSAAQAIDSRVDDGIPNTGKVRAIAGAVGGGPLAAATALAVYDETLLHAICVRM